MENDYLFITKNDAFLLKLKMMLDINYKISFELDLTCWMSSSSIEIVRANEKGDEKAIST